MGKIKCKYKKGRKVIVDVQLSENTKKIVFPAKDASGNELGISLRDCDRIFPSVESIVYENQVVDIPNAMFPNAKEVKTHSTTFCNVFFSEPGMEINLRGFEKIGDKAFEGCKTLNLVGTKNIWSCASNAFQNSVFSEQPFVNGLKIAGTILYDVDQDADVVDIPDYVSCIAVPEKFKGLKKVVIHSLTPKYLSCIANVLKAEEVVLGDEIGNDEFRENLHKFWFRRCSKISISNAMTDFKVEDGCVYEKDSLVLYPAFRNGGAILPDGVLKIQRNAFLHSKISTLKIPDSVRKIEEEAFSFCSNLMQVEGKIRLDAAFFKKCKNLKLA